MTQTTCLFRVLHQNSADNFHCSTLGSYHLFSPPYSLRVLPATNISTTMSCFQNQSELQDPAANNFSSLSYRAVAASTVKHAVATTHSSLPIKVRYRQELNEGVHLWIRVRMYSWRHTHHHDSLVAMGVRRHSPQKNTPSRTNAEGTSEFPRN